MLKKIKNYISKQFIFPQPKSFPHSQDLNGKVILITGASKGTGKAMAELFYNQKANLILVARTAEDLRQILPDAEISRLLRVTADVTKEENVKNLILESLRVFGKIDVVINNAGINIESSLDKLSLTDFNNVISTNLLGTFLVCREVLESMKQFQSGLIINIGSKISHNSNVQPNKVIYATTKYAMEGFSYALNKELKPFGISVVCLMPGTVNTFVSTNAAKYMSPYELAEVVLMVIKLKRIDFEGLVFKSINQDI